MAYGIVHQFAGGTKEQYEASARGRPSLPEVVYRKVRSSTRPEPPPTDGSCFAVHESKESWEQFQERDSMPKLQEGIAGGFTSRPQETVFEVHNLQP